MIPIPFTVLWLIALIVFAVGEAITVGLTSVWFAVGALGALTQYTSSGSPSSVS